MFEKSTQYFDILVTVENFPGFLVFPDQEIGHFSFFPFPDRKFKNQEMCNSNCDNTR